MKKLFLTSIAALFLTTGAAQHEAYALADGPACAMVRRTPDGFLNLRKDFSMSGKIIAKLRPGDQLYVTATELGINTRLAAVQEERPLRTAGVRYRRSLALSGNM